MALKKMKSKDSKEQEHSSLADEFAKFLEEVNTSYTPLYCFVNVIALIKFNFILLPILDKIQLASNRMFDT